VVPCGLPHTTMVKVGGLQLPWIVRKGRLKIWKFFLKEFKKFMKKDGGGGQLLPKRNGQEVANWPPCM
jgi:hypothetical protein